MFLGKEPSNQHFQISRAGQKTKVVLQSGACSHQIRPQKFPKTKLPRVGINLLSNISLFAHNGVKYPNEEYETIL